MECPVERGLSYDRRRGGQLKTAGAVVGGATRLGGIYEHRTHQILAWSAFVRRVRRHAFLALGIVLAAVAIGSVGYHLVGALGWVDAFLNASMILSGMGPVDRMEGATAKVFSACYALFSGLVFIGVSGILTAPWIHRLLHWFHLEQPRR